MRELIYVPEINPRTFLFFFVKGDSGRSYSLRDYTNASGVQVTYAKHYSYTADQIRGMAKHRFDAEVHDTNDLRYWRSEVLRLNRRYLAAETDADSEPLSSAIPPLDAVRRSAPVSPDSRSSYPVFARGELLAHSVKGKKPQDLERIFYSQRSEDWLTWNIVKLLSMIPVVAWWPSLVDLARGDNPDLTISADADDLPLVKPWVPVPSPLEYEKISRARMAQSANPKWVDRATDGRPVEGVSEIDIVFWMNRQIGFIEAKLDADISMKTTYDPQRNQIARNVDCLIERSSGRTPFFWMLTADRGSGRAYTQLVKQYRAQPEILSSELSHRSPEVVHAVARNMAIVVWKDVLPIIRNEFEQIWIEIEARIGNVQS